MVGCEAAPSPVLVATCDQAVGGPFALPAATAVEAAPGYDDSLAGADLHSMPPELEIGSGPFEREILAYALETRPDDLPATLSRDELLARGPMGHAVLYAFAVALADEVPGPDTATLRRGLQRFYACDRRAPLTLDGLFATVGDPRDQPATEIDSRAKLTTRRLRSDPAAGIWMAETLVNGQVRETEVILSGRRADDAFDFLAYDADGNLMDRSRFDAEDGGDISGAAPYVCLVCHRG